MVSDAERSMNLSLQGNLARQLDVVHAIKETLFKLCGEGMSKVVTFAKLALEGKIIQYTSNVIERLMGEVAKRCKDRWMHWSTEGLGNMLLVIILELVKKDPLTLKYYPSVPRDRALTEKKYKRLQRLASD